jgi:hypothetical protein
MRLITRNDDSRQHVCEAIAECNASGLPLINDSLRDVASLLAWHSLSESRRRREAGRKIYDEPGKPSYVLTVGLCLLAHTERRIQTCISPGSRFAQA